MDQTRCIPTHRHRQTAQPGTVDLEQIVVSTSQTQYSTAHQRTTLQFYSHGISLLQCRGTRIHTRRTSANASFCQQLHFRSTTSTEKRNAWQQAHYGGSMAQGWNTISGYGNWAQTAALVGTCGPHAGWQTGKTIIVAFGSTPANNLIKVDVAQLKAHWIPTGPYGPNYRTCGKLSTSKKLDGPENGSGVQQWTMESNGRQI